MTTPRKGICLPVSPMRKMVMELLHHARRVPSLPLGRTLNVTEIALARREVEQPPSWVAILMRAYGLLSQLHPQLRQALIPWPWQHLYQHPHSVCIIPVERDWLGEQVILPAKFRSPESLTLEEIDSQIRWYREAPVWEVSPYRQVLRLGRMPGFIRRFTFWHSLYLSGYTRAKRFGTFVLSSLGNLGVEQFHPLSPLTSYFTFGPIGADGELVAKIIYDHRVMDGRCVARCLVDLDQVLHEDILKELRSRPSAMSRSSSAGGRKRTEVKKPR